MPDPIKAMEIMNQLNTEGGNEPSAKARSRANDKEANPETAKKFESALEKARAEVSKITEQVKSEPKYTGKPYSDPALDAKNPSLNRPFGGGGGAAGDTKFLKPKYKAGGTVKSASSRADGCCIRGKTKA